MTSKSSCCQDRGIPLRALPKNTKSKCLVFFSVTCVPRLALSNEAVNAVFKVFGITGLEN